MRAEAAKSKTGPGGYGTIYGGALRPSGGARTRFTGTSHHGSEVAASLPPNHPAVTEGRPLFPSRVRRADDPGVNRVLKSGVNNAKLGAWIEKGPWAGMPQLTLTLPERATCPRTCELWRACFGNAMPAPERYAPGPELEAQLDAELRFYGAQHAGHGFAVRLHILGDFYSLDYVDAWGRWLDEIPALHVWGYTARRAVDGIGAAIDDLAVRFPARWRIRRSVAPGAPHGQRQVTTVWKDRTGALPPLPAGSLLCPQQTDKTATCGTCGLCWSTAADATRIVFVGHGLNSGGAAKKMRDADSGGASKGK